MLLSQVAEVKYGAALRRGDASINGKPAVILTVEKYESRLPLVSRAQEKVAALAPEAFGVVVLSASRDECLQ